MLPTPNFALVSSANSVRISKPCREFWGAISQTGPSGPTEQQQHGSYWYEGRGKFCWCRLACYEARPETFR